jgi:hypothetical protein
MRKHKVRAVHDDDLLGFLDSIGLRRALETGEIKCHICGKQVTLENLQALLPLNKKFAVVCSEPTCVKNIEVKL